MQEQRNHSLPTTLDELTDEERKHPLVLAIFDLDDVKFNQLQQEHVQISDELLNKILLINVARRFDHELLEFLMSHFMFEINKPLAFGLNLLEQLCHSQLIVNEKMLKNYKQTVRYLIDHGAKLTPKISAELHAKGFDFAPQKKAEDDCHHFLKNANNNRGLIISYLLNPTLLSEEVFVALCIYALSNDDHELLLAAIYYSAIIYASRVNPLTSSQQFQQLLSELLHRKLAEEHAPIPMEFSSCEVSEQDNYINESALINFNLFYPTSDQAYCMPGLNTTEDSSHLSIRASLLNK